MSGNSVTFSPVAGARERVVLLGPPGVLFHRIVNSVRSLQESEYVTFDQTGKNEPSVSVIDPVVLAAARRWYWGRKRDRGFLLTSFPATLGHALVFAEWMDAREETLSRCLWVQQSYASAAAEAARCCICPNDGIIGYAEAETADQLTFCDSCAAPMQSRARDALAAVDHWYQTVGRYELEIARHYADLGLLHQVDAATFETSEVAVR